MNPNLPEHIGAYRILEFMGRGGMGEVFLAEDVKLDRKVALKRIRTDKLGNREHQTRFMREARLAARLHHSNLIQIYSLVEHEDHCYLAMEYINGGSLRDCLNGVPLPVQRCLAMATQILSGLAAMHEAGIVHRDLKPANILIHEGDRVKIADFGIAREYHLRAAESSLTLTGAILGTLGYLSPEQAMGQTQDPRSDLFSLGAILYEMTVGRAPFKADNMAASVHSVLHRDPAPPHLAAPSVPSWLSGLIMHLLQKDRDLRPVSACAVLRDLQELSYREMHSRTPFGTDTQETLAPIREEMRTHAPQNLNAKVAPPSIKTLKQWRVPIYLLLLPLLALLAVLVYRMGLNSIALSDQKRVRSIVVLATQQEGEAPTTIDPGLLIREQAMELQVLSSSLEMVDPLVYAQTEGDLRERARAVAADEFLFSEIVCRSTGCAASLRRLDAGDGRVLASETLQLPVESFELRDAVGAALVRLYQLKDGAVRAQIERPDYEAYLDLLVEEDRAAKQISELVDEAKRLRLRAPNYPPVYTLELRLTRKLSSGPKGQVYQKLFTELLTLARMRFPGDYRFLLTAAEDALNRRDPEKARLILDQLEKLRPDLLELTNLRAKLRELEGVPRAALAIMRQSVNRARSFRNLFNLAIMESRHGTRERARELLAEAEQLAPKHHGIQRLTAQWTLLYGDPREAIARYEALIANSSQISLRNNLGLAYMIAGRFREALAQFERVVDATPHHPLILLNRADATLLTGDTESAKALYLRVIELTAGKEGDWQYQSARAQAHAHLDQPVPALTHLQTALELAPDPAQIAFEAALIHALVGERTSALIQARKALKAGYGPQWFHLPWFRSIREALTRELSKTELPSSGM